jgi:hypothetical protein
VKIGIVLAMLTPVISTLLGIDGSPIYLYVCIDLVQATVAVAAFRLFSIAPSLPKSISYI